MKVLNYLMNLFAFARSKLHGLFNEIEKEFELLYVENLQREYSKFPL